MSKCPVSKDETIYVSNQTEDGSLFFTFQASNITTRTLRVILQCFLFLGTIDRESAFRADSSLHQSAASRAIHDRYLLIQKHILSQFSNVVNQHSPYRLVFLTLNGIDYLQTVCFQPFHFTIKIVSGDHGQNQNKKIDGKSNTNKGFNCTENNQF